MAYDGVHGRTSVLFGPAAKGGPGSTDEDQRSQVLSPWFPGYAFEFGGQVGDLPKAPNLLFQHEDLSNDQVKLFAEEAASLLAGAPDVLQLSQRVRGLTAHGANDLDLGLRSVAITCAMHGRVEEVSCRDFALIYSSACIAAGTRQECSD